MKKFSMAVPVYHITFVAVELLFLCAVLSSAQTTYYVKPDNGTPCPTESDPCLTLSQYAQDFNQYFSSEVDIVLEFLPGEHSLTTELIFANVSGVTLAGDETILEPRSTIVCNPPAGLSFTNITTVCISHLAFLSCGKPGPIPNAIIADRVRNFQLTNTILQGSLGTALFLVSSNATIEQSSYVNNSAEMLGGALAIAQSIVLFKGENLLENNSALVVGGGIYCFDSTLHFTGAVRFSGNVVSNTNGMAGGGAYFNNSAITATGSMTFIANSAFFGFGGGFRAENSSLDLRNVTTFIGNSASQGGGVSVLRSTLTMTGKSIFASNLGQISGGGLDAYISNATLDGNVTFMGNSASQGGGVSLSRSTLTMTGTSIFASNLGQLSGGGLDASISNATLDGNTTFIGNSASQGGGVSVSRSTLTMTGTSIFASNLGSFGGGGGLVAYISNATLDGNITFYNNSATFGSGGAVDAESQTNITLSGVIIFKENIAPVSGGINVLQSSLHISGNSSFVSNVAFVSGGAIDVTFGSLVLSGAGLFQNNSAPYGSALYLFGSPAIGCCSANIEGEYEFTNNAAAFVGGGMYISNSTTKLAGSFTFQNNSAVNQGSAIYAESSTMQFKGNTAMIANTEFPNVEGVLHLSSCITFYNGHLSFIDNLAFEGAGLYAINTIFILTGTATFSGNRAQENGGGLYVRDTTFSLTGTATFMDNRAMENGGGLYSRNSVIRFSGNINMENNSADTQGGAAYLVFTQAYFQGEGRFAKNMASRGGGVSLGQNTVLYLEPPLQLFFDSNSATRGGALFVEDVITLSDCSPSEANTAQSTSESDSECFVNSCFFQINSSDFVRTEFMFVNNSATEAGTVLYGGKLENCTFTPGSQDSGTALDVFMNISSITNNEHKDTSIISSDPIHLCLLYNHDITCDSDSDYLDVQIRRGAKFTIPAVAVGQANGTVPTVVRSYFIGQSGVNAELGENQHIQLTGKNFTDLVYRVFSMRDSEQLVLYPEGPCRDIGIARRSIQIQLLPCPDGFDRSHLECICEKRLQKFTNTCDVDNGTIQRDSDFWMSGLYVNGTYRGLILHPRCPFDYCVTETIYIMPDDPSAQCAFNRAGTLCGSCQSNFSLVLGSSRCLHCSNAYLSLLLPFAVAGLALVMLLLALRLTVSVGTINGLIFYANVLAINRAIFFPPEDTNILTVFIAWLNLDLGIETCFYDGMDAYARTWLQFVFPFYVWSLVGIIMVVSNRSARLSRLLGTNPVSVLATLFLLSYTKILRAILASLRYTYLEYPDGSHVSVWLYDGNIRYFSGKHIPLCLVVLVLLLLFITYTLLLLLGQWLQALSNRKLFSWISKPKVKAFLDAYYGPYGDKHRYWTGMLLLIRLTLSLVFVSNALQNPSTNLLSIASVSLGLSVMTRFTGQIYKKQWLDALEASFILNLGILAAATYHVSLAGGNQAALIYTSVGIAFVSFIGIIIYHIYLQTQNSRLWKSCPTSNVLQIKHHMFVRYRQAEGNENATQEARPSNDDAGVPTTISYVQLRESLLEDN